MSTGGCGISLDRDSVSKEFQSRIVLGKKEYLYTRGGQKVLSLATYRHTFGRKNVTHFSSGV